MTPSIKLITLNIEGDRHLARVIPFLQDENPDVVCLQEVLEKDVDLLKQQLKMNGEYVPMLYIKYQTIDNVPPNNKWGMLVLTKLEIKQISSEFYVKNSNDDELPIHNESNIECNRKILIITVIKDSIIFRIITTHFTWSPNGEPTQLQHQHLDSLLKLLTTHDEFILCGDFNAPRGRAIWERLAAQYTDNIPQAIKTTLDQTLHKVKNLQYVVDGMFSTKHYTVTNVKVVDGVSDHMAIMGNITKLDQ